MASLLAVIPSILYITAVLFEVSDKFELLALHRALFEAKYQLEPEDRDISASPLVAAMSLRVVDALAALDDLQVGEASGWREWQKAERHQSRLPLVRSRIYECQPWSSWTAEEKREYLRVVLAPLVADEEMLAALIAEGDAHHQEK